MGKYSGGDDCRDNEETSGTFGHTDFVRGSGAHPDLVRRGAYGDKAYDNTPNFDMINMIDNGAIINGNTGEPRTRTTGEFIPYNRD